MPESTDGDGGAEIRRELVRTAAFRTELRRFLHQTEVATLDAGLTPQRYDLLLMIKAAADGSESSTVTELCDELDLRQQAVTELVKRAKEAGLITRQRSFEDRRVFTLRLSPEGEARLMRVFDALTNERHSLVDSFRELADRFHA